MSLHNRAEDVERVDDTILILANGSWDGIDRLRVVAPRATYTIATDGAWGKASDAGIAVDATVGDFDSLAPEARTELEETPTRVLPHPPDKDWTDLELAIDLALSRSPHHVILFGAFGGRIDQTLANVFLLERLLDRGVAVEAIAGDETVWLIEGTFALPIGAPGDRVSLLPISDDVDVTTDGLAYPLRNEPLIRAASRGISNVIERVPATIDVQRGRLLVVYGPAETAAGRA